MLKIKAIEHFSSQHEIALALGLSDSAVSQWKDLIPEKAALKLSLITGGVLKYQPDLYTKSTDPAEQP